MLWGVDLGGTKIELAVLQNQFSVETLARRRIYTESYKGYLHIIQQIKILIEAVEREIGVKPDKLGIGTPGTLEPASQLLKNSNTICLNGKPLKHDLENALGIPVELANDANCFALAESTLGAAKEANVVFGVIMGTGVGGGIVFQKQVWNGAHGIAGEWGHNVMDPNGELCYCGKKGCVETFLSGVWLEKFYHQQSGVERKLDEIVRLHLSTIDPIATLTVNRLITNFGKAIATILNILDPDVIVLGGGVGNIELLYSEGIQAIQPHLFNPTLTTKILKPLLGDSAGVFGAAMLVKAK